MVRLAKIVLAILAILLILALPEDSLPVSWKVILIILVPFALKLWRTALAAERVATKAMERLGMEIEIEKAEMDREKAEKRDTKLLLKQLKTRSPKEQSKLIEKREMLKKAELKRGAKLLKKAFHATAQGRGRLMREAFYTASPEKDGELMLLREAGLEEEPELKRRVELLEKTLLNRDSLEEARKLVDEAFKD